MGDLGFQCRLFDKAGRAHFDAIIRDRHIEYIHQMCDLRKKLCALLVPGAVFVQHFNPQSDGHPIPDGRPRVLKNFAHQTAARAKTAAKTAAIIAAIIAQERVQRRV
jgi:hypothetical protein